MLRSVGLGLTYFCSLDSELVVPFCSSTVPTIVFLLPLPLPHVPVCTPRCLRDVAVGLDHIHEHGVVHNDVKPANILVFLANGVFGAKITDFGLATGEKKKSYREIDMEGRGKRDVCGVRYRFVLLVLSLLCLQFIYMYIYICI